MNITTKFDVGDKVWFINSFFNRNTGELMFEIKEGKVEGFYYDTRHIDPESYYIGSHTKISSCVFATQEEAQAECDRRNKEASE